MLCGPGIAPPHCWFNASQCRSRKPAVPFGLVEVGQILESRGNIVGVGLKIFNVSGVSKPLVPRTNVLADVAPGYPTSHVVSDRPGQNGIPIFDRVVGDAAVGIDDIGRRNRLGGAGFQAARAGTAMLRKIGRAHV